MIFSDKDIEFLGDCLRHVAEEEIMPRFRNAAAANVSEKTSSIDLVTQADLRSEAYRRRRSL